MEDTRPYWKVIVSLAFSLIGTILFIVIGIKLLWFFMPFVIGWFIAFIANPLVCWLEKRLKIVKKLGSAIIIIAVLAGVVSALYFGISKLADEVGSLITNFPQMYSELEKGMKDIGESFQGVFRLLPEGIQTGWNAVAAYFFIAERDEVIVWFKKITPKPIQQRMTLVIDNLKYAVGGYFKAQFKIMIVVGVILFIGFEIMQVNYSALLAILIAFLDFLPVFGTGTAIWPWAVYKVLSGDYKMTIMLLVLYGVTQLVRQLIQPKLVGDGLGMQPLVALVLLFVGYKVGSLLGMIFAVPVGMIAINMYKAGAFDYILDDVKILIKGVMSLRE